MIVVTDLDATLLDENYSWQAAAPAIAVMRTRGIPLVLNSSKTVAEMQVLATELQTNAPIVAENGGVIAIGDELRILGLARESILAVAHELRSSQGYRFAGFADWSAAEIADRTGLDKSAAGRANQRLATEPIIWEDTAARAAAFAESLAAHGIRQLAGGRFTHLMGQSDKADGLCEVRKLLGGGPVVALGDSPNDEAMLSAAEIAVVIPNSHSARIAPDAPRVIYADSPGPAGWNAAILSLLDEYKGDAQNG
ncbi:MAG: mannosyl-3-phosphoglycerate phosphatase [Rhodothermales bacterium]|jgi:mannosyl-3-phosphoglycerate phosphatase